MKSDNQDLLAVADVDRLMDGRWGWHLHFMVNGVPVIAHHLFSRDTKPEAQRDMKVIERAIGFEEFEEEEESDEWVVRGENQ